MPIIDDESDGTPEWAKRMFRRLRRLRAYLVLFMLFVGLPAYSLYQTSQAILHDRIWVNRPGPSRWITFAEDPGRFSLEVAVALLVIAVPFVVVIVNRTRPALIQPVKDRLTTFD